MTPEQIFVTIAALFSAPDDSAFSELKAGGFDPAYPVAIVACPPSRPLLDVEGKTIICGTVDVPENHDAPEGNRVQLSFAVLGSHSMAPAGDAIVYLHGGPGGYAMFELDFNAATFEAFRQRRDVVIFDQRASGISAQTVNCVRTRAESLFAQEEAAMASEDAAEPSAAPDALSNLADCLAEVEENGVVLADYNTVQNARDVPALMSALGYAQYNAYGISYGTKLAQEVMRSAPHGLRSVIIDSIAPVDNPSYDTNGVSLDQAIGVVVDLCSEDAECSAAFPDLEATFAAAAARLQEQPIPATASRPEIALQTFIDLFLSRNSVATMPGLTSYLPLMASQFAQGDSRVFDLYVGGALAKEDTPLSIMSPYVGKIDQNLLAIAYATLQTAESINAQYEAIDSLLRQVRNDTSMGPGSSDVETMLDLEISAAVMEMDPATAITMSRTYAVLLTEVWSREAIMNWAEAFISEPNLSRVRALVGIMSDSDVRAFYDRAARDLSAQTTWAGMMFDNAIYACQESVPFNSREGLQASTNALRFPWTREYSYNDTIGFYDVCDIFEQVEWPGLHEPFDTDIPVLAMAGYNDTQTNPDAANHMAAMLSNARAVNFPESGHGVVMFSQCAQDIAVSFIEDPDAVINDSCTAELIPDFVVP